MVHISNRRHRQRTATSAFALRKKSLKNQPLRHRAERALKPWHLFCVKPPLTLAVSLHRQIFDWRYFMATDPKHLSNVLWPTMRCF
jgi:hypothetical protein